MRLARVAPPSAARGRVSAVRETCGRPASACYGASRDDAQVAVVAAEQLPVQGVHLVLNPVEPVSSLVDQPLDVGLAECPQVDRTPVDDVLH